MIFIRGSASPTRCLYRSRSPPRAAAECSVTAQSGAIPWAVTAYSAEEAGPEFVKDRRRTVIAIGFEGLVDRADQLTRPPRSLGGDSHKRHQPAMLRRCDPVTLRRQLFDPDHRNHTAHRPRMGACENHRHFR